MRARTPRPWERHGAQAGFSESEPWLPADPAQQALAVNSQKDAASTLNLTRALVDFRRTSPALRLGDIEFLDAPKEILAFRRKHGADQILCVFNLTEQDVQLPAALRPTGHVIATDAGLSGEADSVSDILKPWSGFWART